MSDNGRDEHGKFTAGNPGGPGRPRRMVEREYILAITAAVTLDDWRAIVDRAKQDALNGDDKARSWLAHYLIGDERVSLLQLAALEHLGIDTDREVAAAADLIQNPPSPFMNFGPEETPVMRAAASLNEERADRLQRLAREELARRKAERAAQKAAQKAEVTT